MKQRPRTLWFVIGAVLMALGVVVGIAVIVLGVRAVLVQDGVVAADGRPHVVTSPTGQQRMAFRTAGAPAPTCTFVDGSGKALLARAFVGSATVSSGTDSWTAFATLDDSGDGRVTVTCTSTATATDVRIGAPVSVGTLGAHLVGGLAILLGVGGAGFLVLLVTTILWIARRPTVTAAGQ